MFYLPLEADVMLYVVHADTESSSTVDRSFHSVCLSLTSTFFVFVYFYSSCHFSSIVCERKKPVSFMSSSLEQKLDESVQVLHVPVNISTLACSSLTSGNLLPDNKLKF